MNSIENEIEQNQININEIRANCFDFFDNVITKFISTVSVNFINNTIGK